MNRPRKGGGKAAASKLRPACEIFILAGGLSTRMGRDKARVRIGSRTMLEHVRAVAKQTGLPVRVIRRDAVARCGPLGGICTAFKRSRADAILFLACDMPFVSLAMLRSMLPSVRRPRFSVPASPKPQNPVKTWTPNALFASEGSRAGFPCLLWREPAVAVVAQQIQDGEFSLQSLAGKLQAKTLRCSADQLVNINTPEELEKARAGG